MARILYISYDGIAEPLGQSQIISYLKKLADENVIHIISFEKTIHLNSDNLIEELQANLKKFGINWTIMRYHKRFSVIATLYDIFRGQIIALKLSKKMCTEIIHVRSYIPALIALPLKWLTNAKFLFDIRGFWADERVDGGIWPINGIVYRVVKNLERYLFRASDHVVTLTENSVSKIKSFGYWDGLSPEITVIPTCADLDLFTPPRKPIEFDPFIFGYVGSFGTWYMIKETMALFLAILELCPDARMIIINQNEHELIKESIAKVGLPPDRIEITKSSYENVASHIKKMHAASALIKPCFSKVASSPTKLAEYLGCGVPCIGNINIGDMEKILEEEGVGVILRDFDTDSLRQAAKKIISISKISSVRVRCRETAISRFSLDKGVEAYRLIYKKLLKSDNEKRLV